MLDPSKYRAQLNFYTSDSPFKISKIPTLSIYFHLHFLSKLTGYVYSCKQSMFSQLIIFLILSMFGYAKFLCQVFGEYSLCCLLSQFSMMQLTYLGPSVCYFWLDIIIIHIPHLSQMDLLSTSFVYKLNMDSQGMIWGLANAT